MIKASNSPSAPSLIAFLRRPSPAFLMKLAGIVATQATSDSIRNQVSFYAKRCEKNPVFVSENPLQWGFVANRICFAMIRVASRIVDESVATHSEVNDLMVDCFGWPVGPFATVKGAGSG